MPRLYTQFGMASWVSTMTALFDAYHVLAAQLLEEEETAKIPASPRPEGRRRLLDYQAPDRESGR